LTSGDEKISFESLLSIVTDRELTDPRAMRALAHPTRLTLLELLSREGPLTATQAGALLGESTPSASYHLRQLAKYGFVVEAEHDGGGRERPWRPADRGQRWSEVSPDPEAAAAAKLLSRLVLEREFDAAIDWIDGAYELSPEWRDAALGSQSILYMTLDELRAFEARYRALLEEDGIVQRSEDPTLRPPGAQPVKVLLLAFPVPPTPSGN
jgi:DNA-binding transcriptional ArsR family regulator